MVGMIGDGLLVYRCYIIWKKYYIAWVLTAIMYAASIAMSLCVNILYATISFSDASAFKIFIAWTFLSVGVNWLVTIMISYKLIRLRNKVLKHAPLTDSRVSLGVVAILVESAVPLAVCGIATAGVGISSQRTEVERSVGTVFTTLWLAFNALSPQMITFKVTLGRSWHEGPEPSLNDASFNLELPCGPDAVLHRSQETSILPIPTEGYEEESSSLRDMARQR
ncbi:hypothetical protein CPB83DRAFT_882750 [Crepidotus variabilis]|uniref:Uncharacterized protein n=1 Tax=Crepidotus variabilis TaxID=179855 RepID=A0A9P6JRG7_9AGAR|nr:hypothetical protein CPB83DRAFT_882750 [Crepidotus variabilis]